MKIRLTKFAKLLTIGLVSASVLAGCGNSASSVDDADKVYTFKFGHAADENNTWHKGAMKFAEEVAERSNGRIEIKVYPSEQLGNEVDNVTAIQAGTADMVLSGESLQNWADIVGIMSTPYLIRDSDHLHKVINGEPGKILEDEIYEKAGLKVLGYFERGPRMLTSNRPIYSLEDVEGLALRVPSVPLFVETWGHWGAKPTPMAFSEVFTSLQQNTIEAQENPIALLNSGGFYEVQKYLNDTHHVRGWIYMLIGADQWEALPDDLKTVMEDAAKAAQEYENQLFLEDESKIFESLINEKGMEFIETDTSGMEKAASEYYQENLDPELLELYNLITNIK